MRKFLLILSLVALARVAAATTPGMFSALADPKSTPDATDASGNSVDFWTVAAGTSSGSYFGNQSADQGMWVIYSTSSTSSAGMITQTHTFDTPLAAGQKVSLDYAINTSIASGHFNGIQLLDAASNIQAEFIFVGGNSGSVFTHDESATGNVAATTGKKYDANDVFNVSFTLTSATSYSGAATTGASGNAGAWTGTLSAPITSIRLINSEAGNTSDVYSDNLAISGVPEPAAWAAMLGGMGLLAGVRFLRRAGKV